ncbi:MAG: TM2 domain-containing protein [Pseudomonadota bacterium]
MPETSADPDFSAEVVAEIYRYRPRRLGIAITLALLFGVLGLHRYYLGKTFTGLLMALSGGGGIVWWLWDLFQIRNMVETYNTEELAREKARLPPQGMGFLPPQDQLDFTHPPKWSQKRSGRGLILGSGLLLSVIGFTLGTVAGSTGTYEPIFILGIFIVTSLTAARWLPATRIPILSGLNRWVHRLRLYYHTVDPGSIWLLALRPFVGLFIAPYQPRARAEVRLYLQLGLIFSLGFIALDLLAIAQRDSTWAGIGIVLGEFVQTLVYTYLFVAPVGALLTIQILLTQRDRVVWILSLLTCGHIYLGLLVVGAA